tara:strand:- start:384 stop:692 length:309 start_codon:yes stop_codon:yes gene_type:complete
VKIGDILAIHQNTEKKTSKNAASRSGSKRLDFVLFPKTDMSPIVAIDLVHNSGKDGYKSQREFFVSGALMQRTYLMSGSKCVLVTNRMILESVFKLSYLKPS